jgi:hypothetical protein
MVDGSLRRAGFMGSIIIFCKCLDESTLFVRFMIVV